MQDYETKLAEQQGQYKSGEEIHQLPEIFHYWSYKYLRPKIEEVFNVSSVRDFYAQPLLDLFSANAGTLKFVSIGSGDCCYEIEIAEYLLSQGRSNFQFQCMEVNENLIAQARASVQNRKLGNWVSPAFFDVNRENISGHVDAFMAHQALHHIVELERLFDLIDVCLLPHGKFLTQDMIGRNGHLRWPEVLNFVNSIWAVIASDKKYNHQMKRNDVDFVNFDCSKIGFEGIRSQDILPLMLGRFSFAGFFATGGLVEVFFDRAYGPNYSKSAQRDLEFVDFIEMLNASLIEFGFIKPTIMFAELRRRGLEIKPRLYRNRSPEFCVRPPS